MKKQVVIIHGGNTYTSYGAYLKNLKSEKADKDDFKPSNEKRWRETLDKRLGSRYEVFTPEMPNWMNAKYLEWKIWFEKVMPFLRKGTIFVGHSCGGIFLSKYFAENPDRKQMKALFLIAAPFTDVPKEKIADFALPKSLKRLDKLGSKVHLYFSKDDRIVPFSHFKMYKKELPAAQVRVFDNKGHFRLKEFPELVKDIKSL